MGIGAGPGAAGRERGCGTGRLAAGHSAVQAGLQGEECEVVGTFGNLLQQGWTLLVVARNVLVASSKQRSRTQVVEPSPEPTTVTGDGALVEDFHFIDWEADDEAAAGLTVPVAERRPPRNLGTVKVADLQAVRGQMDPPFREEIQGLNNIEKATYCEVQGTRSQI